MKNILIFILAFVVMAGSVNPCCQTDDCQHEVSTQTSHKDQDHEQGTCSPFFACGSCVGFVQLARHFTVPVPTIEQPAHFEKLTSFSTSLYYSSFFQPPRNSKA